MCSISNITYQQIVTVSDRKDSPSYGVVIILLALVRVLSFFFLVYNSEQRWQQDNKGELVT